MCVKYPTMVSCDCWSQTRIVWLMLFRQKISIEIWQRMLQLTTISFGPTPLWRMNRKALGFFKGELNPVPIQQFVGLRPKCYVFLCTSEVSNNVFQHTNPVEKKAAKGVKCWVKDAHLQFAHYLDALNNFHTYLRRQKLIRSTLHTVRTVHMCKVGLTAYDTKRWLCDDTSHTHAHGHRSTLL